MTALLTRVKTTLSIRAHRRVRGMLDGEYASIFRGKSHEFDDIRPYVPGDEIRDIDWKATARAGYPLVKQFIAHRKQTVTLVVDTGRDLAATGSGGEPKRDVAILVAGVLGYIAARHGDRVGLIAGDADEVRLLEPKGAESHLERLLQVVAQRARLDGAPSDVRSLLERVVRTVRKRMLLVVVVDDAAIDDETAQLVRRLAVQHEILWITVGDADVMAADWATTPMVDVADDRRIPDYLRRDRRLRTAFAEAEARRASESADRLDALAVSHIRVARSADVVPSVLRLIEGHNNARR
ncbi:uncharacterized protein DUF58 [Labedella gwakjiensis]|uniref:DUF58 domain-containing protein n=1 Tax=Labedella gwakjiensis TaxID=390269 RepID=A0A2P8GYB8_9MICO|nr:DUF58 domain-containing protein [Labedella gwakjiensis]PSL38968.1 uncharacterized protein DUF58 [Labedella gwakjiensis]RUQ86574.1 DUF58 domain-containing protein [Labedella gwakjiensis]